MKLFDKIYDYFNSPKSPNSVRIHDLRQFQTKCEELIRKDCFGVCKKSDDSLPSPGEKFEDFCKRTGYAGPRDAWIEYQEPDVIPNRPDWDSYFLSIADVVATRSEDLYIRHGSVIVKNGKVVSCGFNGLPKGFDHNRIDLKDRDYRRKYMIHSECNSILFSKSDLSNATIYITGIPCRQCTLMIINSGISRIVCRNSTGSITHSEEDKKIIDILIEQSGIKYEVVL
jgi:dCMP deaminase